MNGAKIGWTMYDEVYSDDKTLTVTTQSHLEINNIGTKLVLDSKGEMRYDKLGNLTYFRNEDKTQGNTTVIILTSKEGGFECKIDRNGQIETKNLNLPVGTKFTMDPVTEWLRKPLEAGQKYVTFDTQLFSLVQLEVADKGSVQLDGQPAHRYDITYSNYTTEMYLNAKGQYLETRMTFGVVQKAEPKEVAINIPDGVLPELSDVASIKLEGGMPEGATSLKLKLSGENIRLPASNAHQTVRPTEREVLVSIHPAKANEAALIENVKKNQEEWLQPDSFVEADKREFAELAAKILDGETRVAAAAEKLRQHVFRLMKVNGGFGVLRPANEILRSSEGVCRDHAILLATLCRAAGIPTKVVSGLICIGERYYYHSWVEYYDGDKWVGMDSTRGNRFLTINYLVMATGHTEDCYNNFLLENVKISTVKN